MMRQKMGQIGKNAAVCFLFYAGLALTAEIYSVNAGYLLLIGILFCMCLPYTRLGLKGMHQHIGCRDSVAVDYHPRARKGFLNRRGNMGSGYAASRVRRPLFTECKQFWSAALPIYRLLSPDSARQPDNLR